MKKIVFFTNDNNKVIELFNEAESTCTAKQYAEIRLDSIFTNYYAFSIVDY